MGRTSKLLLLHLWLFGSLETKQLLNAIQKNHILPNPPPKHSCFLFIQENKLVTCRLKTLQEHPTSVKPKFKQAPWCPFTSHLLFSSDSSNLSRAEQSSQTTTPPYSVSPTSHLSPDTSQSVGSTHAAPLFPVRHKDKTGMLAFKYLEKYC